MGSYKHNSVSWSQARPVNGINQTILEWDNNVSSSQWFKGDQSEDLYIGWHWLFTQMPHYSITESPGFLCPLNLSLIGKQLHVHTICWVWVILFPMLIDLASSLTSWRFHLIPCPSERSAKCLRGLSLHTVQTSCPKQLINTYTCDY